MPKLLSNALFGVMVVAGCGLAGTSASAQVEVVNAGFESHSMLPHASGQFYVVDGCAHGGGAEAIPVQVKGG